MPKLQSIYELNIDTAKRITKSGEHWTSYLNTSSRLYKYSFNDQVLIFAQRPEATACASMELWNNRIKRWVNRGSKGIALVDDTKGKSKLRYVFDIADTHKTKYTKSDVKLWEFDTNIHDFSFSKVEEHFGIDIEKQVGSIEERVYQLVNKQVSSELPDIIKELEYNKEDSLLDGLDEQNTNLILRKMLTNSIAYSTMMRMGLEAENYFYDEDFLEITNFNTFETLSILGTATSNITKEILVELAKQIEIYENKEKRLDKNLNSSYSLNPDRNVATNRKYELTEAFENKGGELENEDNIQTRGRLPSSELGTTGGRENIWEVRENEKGISQGTQGESLQQSTYARETPQTLGRDRRTSSRETGSNDGSDEKEIWNNRRNEERRYDEMGVGSQQYKSDGRRSDLSGVNLQLEEFPTIEQQQKK